MYNPQRGICAPNLGLHLGPDIKCSTCLIDRGLSAAPRRVKFLPEMSATERADTARLSRSEPTVKLSHGN